MSAKTAKEIYDILVNEFDSKTIVEFFDPAESKEEDPKKKPVGDTFIVIEPQAVTRVCNFLRENEDLKFNSLICLSGVDRQGEPPILEVVYHLFSFKHRHRVNIKARLPKESPTIKSVQSIWSGANWFERETYDLLGIKFENHPDLRRIMLPPDWVGHPLRKDYEFPKEYNGISCVRPKLK